MVFVVCVCVNGGGTGGREITRHLKLLCRRGGGGGGGTSGTNCGLDGDKFQANSFVSIKRNLLPHNNLNLLVKARARSPPPLQFPWKNSSFNMRGGRGEPKLFVFHLF